MNVLKYSLTQSVEHQLSFLLMRPNVDVDFSNVIWTRRPINHHKTT